MSLILLLVVVVAAGAVLSVQAAINGRLGETVGVLRSSLLTFAVGTVVTALLIVFFEPAHAVSLLDVPKWQLAGALRWATRVISGLIALRRRRAESTLVCPTLSVSWMIWRCRLEETRSRTLPGL